jgi:coenzyme F420-reducing hydrogenase beta subunit
VSQFYAGWSRDEETRIRSSSGGIFPEIAKYILENGDAVFGVGWDEKLNARHLKVE